MRPTRGRNGANSGYPYRGNEATVAIAEGERPTVPPPGPPPPGPPREDREVWPWVLALVVLALAATGGGYALTRGDAHHAARQRTVVVTQAVLPVRTTARKPVHSVPKSILVPNVVGMAAARAAAALTKAGFVPVRQLAASPKPKGRVVDQHPAASTKLGRGARITLLVSNGLPLAVVPSVIGQTQPAAESSLNALGLEANIVHVASTQQAGTVIAQNPASGTKAPKGSSVRLNVSRGGPSRETSQTTKAVPAKPVAATVSVPDLDGLKLQAARTAVRNAGLITEIRYVPSQLAAGTITGQSPKPGTGAKRGAHVFITVSQGGNSKQLKAVPDVVGQDEAAARQTLQAAGFAVDEVDQPTNEQSQDGLVVDEQPQSGTNAPNGSDVTVYIGRYSPSG